MNSWLRAYCKHAAQMFSLVNYSLSTLSVKIVATTHNPLLRKDKFRQMLSDEISCSNLQCSTEWKFAIHPKPLCVNNECTFSAISCIRV